MQARSAFVIDDAAANIPNGSVLRTDLCIVGGGPVGLALAQAVASLQCRVIVLESGGRSVSHPAKDLTAAEQSGDLWQPVRETRTRGLGGTSLQWTSAAQGSPHGGLRSHPLTNVDFHARPWLPASGWPFHREALLPYLEGAHTVLQLGDFDYGPPTQLPLNLDPTQVETTQVRFSSSAAIVELESQVAGSPHIDVLLNATALTLEEGNDGTIEAVCVRSGDRQFSVTASCFVLAGGGIENARLLLLSDTRTPGGIGNHHDLVGRYFMEHLTVSQGLIAGAGLGPPSKFERQVVGSSLVQPVWRIAEEVMQREELLGAVLAPVPAGAFSGRFFAANAYLRPLGRLARRPLGPLRSHFLRPVPLATMAGRAAVGLITPPRAIGIHAHIEQPPRRENRVTLSDKTDALGQRQARIEWRIGNQERDSLIRNLRLFDNALRSSRAGRLIAPPTVSNFSLLAEQSHHHIGTTRMHPDPEQGVVDADCRVHGTANLYIAGSSVMPTGGAATVTLTALALALRLADHLRRRLDAFD